MIWFRRDLRLADNPALLEAVAAGPDGVVPLFVLDERFRTRGSAVRWAYLGRVLASAASRIPLQVVAGDPREVVPRVARAVGASSVHISAEPRPRGARRDAAVEERLEVDLVRTGSPYAITPGRVTKPDGTPYRVFTAYFRAWTDHGWPSPAPAPDAVPWLPYAGPTASIPAEPAPDGVTLPPAGEHAALEAWHHWLDRHVDRYHEERDRPDLDTTSRMSVHLAWGAIHPRTMLADLARIGGPGASAHARQLAFREFYADVLHHWPHTATDYVDPRFARMRYDEPSADLEAWKQGRTGIPIVDAGMRQLLTEGWMHNRVRMIVASFLTKDLHVRWQHGSRHFLDRLVDADLASNQHGWQWVAGCGTDAAPYFRIFNPVTQGKKFDPDGTYVRRHVPELRDVPDRFVHEPWQLDQPPGGYPPPMVDHAAERREALRRYEAIR